jgi:alpha-tubulin suppressor-like RCC1 family protein
MFGSRNFLLAKGGSGAAPIKYELWTWGHNAFGLLGLGNTTSYSSPKQVGALDTWEVLSSQTSYYSGMSITSDGLLWTWGRNQYGQLGLGNTTNYSSPVQVGALKTWSKLGGSFTYYSVAAIKKDGTLWTWGRNTGGTLGLGDGTPRSSPVQVGALTTWSFATTGTNSMVAIKTDGTLWSWGRNNNGQLGLGNTTEYASPKQVGSLTTWASVSAGGSFCVAIKTDGTIWSWGYNSNYGKLGLGNTTSYSSPVQIGGLTNWSKVSAHGEACSAIKTDGTLWSWGRNSEGQLGTGNTTNRSSPVQVGSLTDWSQIKSMFRGCIAIKTDGTLWTWGRNNNGALGLGDTTNRSSPVQVGALTTWEVISGGGRSCFALKEA